MRNITALLFIFSFFISFAQQEDSLFSLTFDFNEHQLNEVGNKVTIKPVGVYLTTDRFGNEESAVYLQGAAESYLNLGTSPLLKSTKTTISLWVNLDRRVYMGKGYDFNPIYIVKNRPQDDFYVAYAIAYDGYSNRYAAVSTLDSIKEASVVSKEYVTFRKWHHFVITSDYNFFAFYVDGELQAKVKKGFETVFLKSDSVVIGHSANKKNFRFSQGTFDDIQIFHRVLSESEIKELYNAPNPNRFKIILFAFLKIISLIAAILLIAFLLVASRRKSLKREQEKFELKSKMSEMEIRVIKAQINPHFMANCLSAVQHLIITNRLEAANDYLAKFGFIVRQVLNFSTKSLVTLQEELEIVKLNIELEQLRFEDQFIFNLQIDKEVNTNNILIPPLIFQPIIENAIWHGLLPLKYKSAARLDLLIHKQNEALVIIIEDNGVGRKQKNADIGNSKDSKGIKITTQRIENLNNIYSIKTAYIVYKDLFDKDKMPAGTKVTICLPLNLVSDNDD